MKRGFTLVEALLVLFILSSAFLLVHPVFYKSSMSDESIYLKQLEAMALNERVYINDDFWFNANGNINHAGTSMIQGSYCIFQLGFGRFRCE